MVAIADDTNTQTAIFAVNLGFNGRPCIVSPPSEPISMVIIGCWTFCRSCVLLRAVDATILRQVRAHRISPAPIHHKLSPECIQPFMFSVLKKSRTRRFARVPDGTVLYVVGDIHGRADRLEAVQEKIDRDPQRLDSDRCIEVYLGDYVDRGPDSRRVLTGLIKRSNERNIITLRGNHEQIMGEALADERVIEDWRPLGGLATISSYGVRVAARPTADQLLELHQEWVDAVPDAHRAFLSTLVNWASEGDYFFAHAGVRPGVPLEDQSADDLLWIRDLFLNSAQWHGKVVVHGHTPVKVPEFLPNRINIDTGAYITGNLTCLRLVGEQQAIMA